MGKKVFKGSNFKEIIEKIKNELGKDAIVHSTKISEKRNFFLFGKKKKIFEVEASEGIKIPNKSIGQKQVDFYNEIKNLEIGKEYESIYEQLIENEIDPILAKSMILNFSIRIPSELPYSQKIESMKEMIKNFFKECLVSESSTLDKVSI
jgi:predicted RNA-binding protein Jag